MIDPKDVITMLNGFLYILIFAILTVFTGLFFRFALYILLILLIAIVILLWLQRNKYDKGIQLHMEKEKIAYNKDKRLEKRGIVDGFLG
jgi:glucan phosphoethanolaminetransferase (alkaline phosphatase superfamily)